MSIDKLKTKFFTGAWLTDVKHYFTKINEIIDWINNIGSTITPNYKVYTALLTQAGTDAPDVIVLQNTLGGVPIWTRSSAGVYVGTLNNSFTTNKTFCIINVQDDAGENYFNGIASYTNSTISVTSASVNTQALADDILNNISIEIRVYN